MKTNRSTDSNLESSAVQMTWPAPLLDLACAVAAQKYIIITLMVIGLVLGTIRLILMPSIYTASAVAVLLPREKPVLDVTIDTSSIETTNDHASRSTSGNLMLPPNPTLYTTLIYSRPVLSQIAIKFSTRLDGHLSPRDRSNEVIQHVRSMITVASTEEGLITITVSSKDPELSADIANELFFECQKASKSIERQLILQQAGHLENALENSMRRMKQTESTLSAFNTKYGLVNTELQVSNHLRSVRELSTEKDSLQTDLQELRLSYSDRSPEVLKIQSRIKSIKKQQQTIQTGIVGSMGTSDYGSLIVAHDSLKQKVRFERDLVATLATKVDIYRIRAEEPTGNLAVIREAVTPSRPSGPSKKRELGIALGLCMMLGIGWSILVNQWKLAQQDTYLSQRISDFISLAVPKLPFRKFSRTNEV